MATECVFFGCSFRAVNSHSIFTVVLCDFEIASYGYTVLANGHPFVPTARLGARD